TPIRPTTLKPTISRHRRWTIRLIELNTCSPKVAHGGIFPAIPRPTRHSALSLSLYKCGVPRRCRASSPGMYWPSLRRRSRAFSAHFGGVALGCGGGASRGVDPGLLALRRRDRSRRAGQQVAAGGRLRERDHVADG